MFKSIRLSLLAGCIAATCQAWAAPAGDLPLMPWPQQVDRPSAEGTLVIDNAISIKITGDKLPGPPNAGVSAFPGKLAGSYNRHRPTLQNPPSTFKSNKRLLHSLNSTAMKATN